LAICGGRLIAPPLARLERQRLRMDHYTYPATWREVGYACLLATVAPVLSIAALLAFIGDRPSVATTAPRLDGYRAALRDAHIDDDPNLIALNVTSSTEAADTATKLLDQPDPPTAIFSSNSKCSAGVVPALQATDRTDVALVSFGDIPSPHPCDQP
jgi:ABC-type sugar transport system substrate-binding protein